MSDAASITVTRKRGFTVVYNDLLPADGTLSARAWGLYVYLVGRPDGWECRAAHLRTVFKEGRDAIYAALRELVDHGLMAQIEYVEDGLRRVRYSLDVEQKPRSAPETDSQDAGNPGPGPQDAGSPDSGKAGQVSKDSPTERATTDGAKTEEQPDADAPGAEPIREDVARVCEHLSARLTAMEVKHTVGKTWHDAARRMMDLDHRTERQVHNMIEWATNDSFWRSNVLSMPTLRDKYDQMRLKALGQAPTNVHHTPDSPLARDDAWEAPRP